MKRNTLALALALALVTCAAQAEVVDLKWNDEGQFRHAAKVGVRGSLEVCGRLPAGLTIDWSYTSAAPLESNVHFHEGKQVVYPAKHAASISVTDQLRVGVEQDYCWMWTNRTAQPVQLNVQLAKAK